MKYILSDTIALRSWRLVPYACYVRHQRNACGLKEEEFNLLKRCDGQQEIEDNPVLTGLLERGLCRPAKQGDTLTKWQRWKNCDNRYFPAINWMVTGKCNFNCLHCFNATGNDRIQNEFSLEEAKKLICEAENCGINAFTITGGEPMLHPHFMQIVECIYEHDMYIEELNTNGFFITQKILDEMKAIGCRPLMKISFDGSGHHDWMRNHKGAEKDALRAIRLCKENGFPVKAQTNVHRRNVDSMLPTAKLLADMGVDEMRIIRTTEVPRWLENAGDSCLTLTEYYDRMLQFCTEYIQSGCEMEIDIWQFVNIWPRIKAYRPHPLDLDAGKYRDSIPVCRGNRGMVAVGANGNLYPCHQLSGTLDSMGSFLGNVKEDGLQPHLQDGDYLYEVCTTLGDLKKHNGECGACNWFRYCAGGCRALAVVLQRDKFGSDPSKCLFFRNGYLDKLARSMDGYYNTAII